MERHKQAVNKIATAVRGFFDRREPYRIFHGSTNTTRPGTAANTVDISPLRHVLCVDRARRTALVEPNVPMDRLVEATLRHGLVPPVVMEFPGITAGGGYAGTAGESSSFRHGFFDETLHAVEMVLGDGRVVRAAPHGEHADLFRGAAGALGTLGVATLLELRLVDAARFVRTTYHRVASVAEAVARVRAETEDPRNDYVDAILFAPDHGVVVTGRRTDELPPGRTPQTFSRASDPWFYLHAQERTADTNAAAASTRQQEPHTDYVPLAEYLFRYDRAGFWVGAQGWTYFKLVPFNRWTRWLLDDFVHTRMMYRALHASGESARFVVQDLALPYHNAEAFIDYATDRFGIWPLWLCPLKAPPASVAPGSSSPPPTFHPHTGLTEPLGTTAATASYSLPPSSPSPSSAPKTAAAADNEPVNDTTTTPPQQSSQQQQQPAPMLNIGLWGWGPRSYDDFVARNRDLEDRLRRLGGRKWLYAHTYYDPDTFWSLYDRPAYDALRAKYAADTLPTVYDKVHVDVDAERRRRRHDTAGKLRACWPLGGVYGIWRAIRSGDYHLHRNALWKYKPDK